MSVERKINRNKKKNMTAKVHKSLDGKLDKKTIKKLTNQNQQIVELKWSGLLNEVKNSKDALNSGFDTYNILKADATFSKEKLAGYKAALDNMQTNIDALETKVNGKDGDLIDPENDEAIFEHFECQAELLDVSTPIATVVTDMIGDMVSANIVVGLGDEAKELKDMVDSLPEELKKVQETELSEEEKKDV